MTELGSEQPRNLVDFYGKKKVTKRRYPTRMEREEMKHNQATAAARARTMDRSVTEGRDFSLDDEYRPGFSHPVRQERPHLTVVPPPESSAVMQIVGPLLATIGQRFDARPEAKVLLFEKPPKVK